MINQDLVTIDENNKKIFILYKEEKIEINIFYRKVKNISIKIIPKNEIEIISPKSVSIQYIKEVIIKKMKWILKTLDKLEHIDDTFMNREFNDNDIFFYLGKELKLKIILDNKKIENKKKQNCLICINEEHLSVVTTNNDKEFIKKHLKQWYKIESEKIIASRIEYLKSKNLIMRKLNPSEIKIKEQKKRWGSCTSTKKIYINSKISMAKVEVIDYIIVHEFAHLVYMNHSKDFYKLVSEIMPNYKESERWLKENSYKLNI